MRYLPALPVIAGISRENASDIEKVIDLLEAASKPVTESVSYYAQKAGFGATLHVARADHMDWLRKFTQMAAGVITVKPR